MQSPLRRPEEICADRCIDQRVGSIRKASAATTFSRFMVSSRSNYCRQAYKDIFVITMTKTVAVFFVIAVYYLTGIY
jgi:hypothetical protein